MSSERAAAEACDYSVVVCTRNRSERLGRALTGILASMDAAPGQAGELVVVDNGSTDGTAAILARMSASDGRLRTVAEPTPGIGLARQRGFSAARGRIILWTDDDIVVPRQWVSAMLRPIQNGQADAVAGGIAIADDLWRPWMTDDLAARYYAHVPEPPATSPGLVGANMAYRREIGERVRFDPLLGTARYPGSEDVLVYVQALEAGYRIRGVDDALVEHHFDPARLSAERLESLASGYGRCDAYFFHHWLHAEYPLGSARIAKHAVGWLLARARGGRFDERVLSARRSVAFHLEMQRLRGTPRRYAYRGIGLLDSSDS